MSLRENARTRIVEDMIGYAQSRSAALHASAAADDLEAGKKSLFGRNKKAQAVAEKYMVMIVDKHTLKVLSGSCKNYNILEKGITVVEQLEKVRQPVPEFDAIYFLSPLDESINLLIKDFSGKQPMYKRAHVFFSFKLSDTQMETLARASELVNRCGTFAELYLHYVPYESRAFTSDQPLALNGLSSEATATRSTAALLTVCATLKERPVIRFQRGSAGGVCEKVATALKREGDALWGKLEKTGVVPKSQPATVLVLDRSADTSALWLHEFFYEAMALDVLDGTSVQWSLGLEDPKEDSSAQRATSVNATFTYDFVSGKGAREKKQAILSDQDDIWSRLRGLHFHQARETLNVEIQEFKKKHSALTSISKGEEGKVLSTEMQLQALRSLPEYQELMGSYWAHIELTGKCDAAVNDLKLMDVTKLEHELCTGLDEDGKEVTAVKLLTALTGLLQHGGLADEQKLRLCLLYATQMGDISESSVQALIKSTASLKPEYQQIFNSFLGLGLPGATRFTSAPKPVHRMQADKNLMKLNKQRCKDATLANSRFVSRVTALSESALTGTLDENEFPFVDGQRPAVRSSLRAPAVAGKSAAAQWGLVSNQADDLKTRLIVFVVGGVTLNELRTTQKLAGNLSADIYMGGSTILTPKRLVEILLVGRT